MSTSRGAQVVLDPSDARLDPYRDLRTSPGAPRRRERNLDWVVIEGRLALQNALKGPLEPVSVLVSPNRLDQVAGIVPELPVGVPVLSASRQLLEEVTGFDVHRGILACARRPPPREATDMLGASRRVAVLVGLGDLENTGAVFRVAAALGLDAVLLDAQCADPLYRRCVRVSLGWSTVVPHVRLPIGTRPVPIARAAGHTTVALTPRSDSVPVDVAVGEGLFEDPVAFVVGAEGPGLDDDTIDCADAAVSIPMAAGVDSLNAATALAVVSSFAAASRGWA